MGTKNILKRGFKAQAERLATKYRNALNIHPCGVLCAFELAKYLNIPIYSATDFINDPKELSMLQGENNIPCEWSALTLLTKAQNRIIINNPYHAEARKQSDIMHELAHIICGHKREQKEYNFPIPFGMYEYDETQEEEAKCLGATLQLAKPCLFWARKRNMSIENIASHFNASTEMVRYRINMTGIKTLSI